MKEKAQAASQARVLKKKMKAAAIAALTVAIAMSMRCVRGCGPLSSSF